MSWLASLLIKPIMDWLWAKIAAVWSAYQKDKADHAKAVNQAAQDNEKATHINEESKSDDVDSAIEDSLKHL